MQQSAPSELPISADFPFEKRFIEVNGRKMAYVDTGSGPIILFIHGNPTSSYLWRNIIPYVSNSHRAIAVDLIGMGDSDKPAIDYSFTDHADHLDKFIRNLGLTNITLVIHDWGSVLGMRYARLNEANVVAVAFMEALIPPTLPIPSYEAMGPAAEFMRNIRTEGIGEELILDGNFFVETVLPQNVMREFTEQEMNEYRRPFSTRESRIPTLMWPRSLPIGGSPETTAEEITANGKWLEASPTPKLLLHAFPGVGIDEASVEYARSHIRNLDILNVGEGLHFLQEDCPHEIGQALSKWTKEIEMG